MLLSKALCLVPASRDFKGDELMQVNLNDPNEFTIENIRQLIASKDDSNHRQLRVTKSGIAYLSDEVGADNTADLAFRFETWCQGNGYCGLEASNDDSWVNKVFGWLKENWPHPKSSYIDY